MSKFSAALLICCVLHASTCYADQHVEETKPVVVDEAAVKPFVVNPEYRAFLDRIGTPIAALEALNVKPSKIGKSIKDIKIPTVAEVEEQLKEFKLPAVGDIKDSFKIEDLNVEEALKQFMAKHQNATFDDAFKALKIDNIPALEDAFKSVKFGSVDDLEAAMKNVDIDAFQQSVKEAFEKPLWVPTRDELNDSIREAVDEITATAGKFTGDEQVDGAAMLVDMLKNVNPDEVVENIKAAVAEFDIVTPEIKQLEDMTAVISPELVKEAIEEMVADLSKMAEVDQ